MIDFNVLSPEVRCAALVGEFLRRWSEMEIAMHQGIAIAMKLDDTMQSILCANVQLRDKLNILRTIVDVSNIDNDAKEKFKKILRDIGEYSPIRNMMAHDNFSSDEKQTGVVFFQVKAKGKFSKETPVWDIDAFLKEYEKIENFKLQIISLQDALRASQFSFRNFVVQGEWANTPLTMRRIASSDLIHFLSHPIPPDLDSDPANPETKK
jgi:hypothetical protein